MQAYTANLTKSKSPHRYCQGDQIYTLEKKPPKCLGPFCHFQKIPKENNRPISEKSPNLVTLVTASNKAARCPTQPNSRFHKSQMLT
jgi:hypothetical protein